MTRRTLCASCLPSFLTRTPHRRTRRARAGLLVCCQGCPTLLRSTGATVKLARDFASGAGHERCGRKAARSLVADFPTHPVWRGLCPHRRRGSFPWRRSPVPAAARRDVQRAWLFRQPGCQYHWGGGTPELPLASRCGRCTRRCRRHFTIDPSGELALEVDPRVTSFEQLETLRALGFNRLSLGVQDFDAGRAAGRQPHPGRRARRAALVAHARALGFASINIDLIYGLPRQTVESFARTVDTVIDLRPDRVAAYSFAHVPWIRAHQKLLKVEELPSADRKLQLFVDARARFLAAGYRPIGMDHFALPDDELARAADAGTLHRNFMGYTTRPAPDMIGLGVSAIGDVAGAFAQNTKKLSALLPGHRRRPLPRRARLRARRGRRAAASRGDAADVQHLHDSSTGTCARSAWPRRSSRGPSRLMSALAFPTTTHVPIVEHAFDAPPVGVLLFNMGARSRRNLLAIPSGCSSLRPCIVATSSPARPPSAPPLRPLRTPRRRGAPIPARQPRPNPTRRRRDCRSRCASA